MELHNALNNKLPKHSPDQDFWARIEDSLQATDADKAFQSRLQHLPQHAPSGQLWQQIEHKLGQRLFLYRALKFTAAAAAALLLFFTLPNFFTTSEVIHKQQTNNNQLSAVPKILPKATQGLPEKSDVISKNTNYIPIKVLNSKEKNNPGTIVPNILVPKADVIPDNHMPLLADISPIVQTQSESIQNVQSKNLPVVSEIQKEGIRPDFSLPPTTTANNLQQPSKKYITPDDPKIIHPFSNLAVAMNYQPEAIYNGMGNSLFHNLDLTASYNKEKIRYITSVGMSYNTENFELAVNYDKYQPVTAPGPNGTTDTISYLITNFDSEFIGTEKHEYLTYGFGIARKIFKTGKLSTWFNAGAGFAVKLSTPDIKQTTTTYLEEKYNAEVNSISSNQPVYNPWNMNFVTGIDFNYQIFNRISFTFTPISRWYFKPVLTQNNQATDELTLGFRTGVKIDF